MTEVTAALKDCDHPLDGMGDCKIGFFDRLDRLDYSDRLDRLEFQ